MFQLFFLFIVILTYVNAWSNCIVNHQKQRFPQQKNMLIAQSSYLKNINHDTSLQMAEVFELEDETEADGASNQTDEQLGKTHGYEGSFKIGDIVKVNSPIRVWHVKAYSKEGFLATGFQGRVQGFDLYGRKFSSLCSAITPIKVEFQPDGEGMPAGNYNYFNLSCYIIFLPSISLLQ